MVHQRDEKRQIGGCHAFFVERQDEVGALGGQEEIRVLDTFGDALARQHLADVVERGEGAQLVVADFGIDRHGLGYAVTNPAPTRLVRQARLA